MKKESKLDFDEKMYEKSFFSRFFAIFNIKYYMFLKQDKPDMDDLRKKNTFNI